MSSVENGMLQEKVFLRLTRRKKTQKMVWNDKNKIFCRQINIAVCAASHFSVLDRIISCAAS
jgi:hypothetical protein